ncbi:MAG: nitroreductase family protein [Promethearchaeota archaeon]
MDALDCLRTRRSIRKFQDIPISKDIITQILEIGHLSPSGRNLQPWRVIIAKSAEIRQELAQFSKYSKIISDAGCVFAIYLDHTQDYSRMKNLQSIGAFFQSLLLAIHAVGLGGVWIGEILNRTDDVNATLHITNPKMELMGIIAFGTPDQKVSLKRIPLDNIILHWF